MPEITTTGWERKIREYADEHGLVLSRSKVQRVALRVAKRARSYWDFDLDDYMRIAYADITGETAVNNVLIERSF